MVTVAPIASAAAAAGVLGSTPPPQLPSAGCCYVSLPYRAGQYNMAVSGRAAGSPACLCSVVPEHSLERAEGRVLHVWSSACTHACVVQEGRGSAYLCVWCSRVGQCPIVCMHIADCGRGCPAHTVQLADSTYPLVCAWGTQPRSPWPLLLIPLWYTTLEKTKGDCWRKYKEIFFAFSFTI